MANMFALILAIATLITGIIWCIDKVKFAPARRALRAQVLAQTAGTPDEKAQLNVTPRSGWVETLASIFPVLAVVFIVRSFVYEPFQIPSGSMMPTLLIGDFIVVEKFAYGLKDPITQTTLIPTGHPQRGDIVVFKYPRDTSLDYIKRVIGVPGDRVTYDALNKTLTVMPACAGDEPCTKALPVTYSDVEPSPFIQTFGGYGGRVTSGGFWPVPLNESMPDGIRLDMRKETLGDVTHNILLREDASNDSRNYYQQAGSPQSSWLVPEGHYFMMGDNRDNSADSRYWGFVPEKNIVGKATGIWMSFEKQEGQWPTGVRLSRIGGIH
ncbi:signal peptidase I [Mixta tenebrionis]|uniref:Signal peptidase I n=1 Tax=Mixta tenebrionis TaxID=2562439 RepID=A0A506VBG3_9GAMM|nr:MULTISPECIES: signal peptidase I [Mixta]QHM74532.1 Signal peptidase I [Mixta theicola]TPW42363.1 signal peptidase I [Mixta tenebrionis]